MWLKVAGHIVPQYSVMHAVDGGGAARWHFMMRMVSTPVVMRHKGDKRIGTRSQQEREHLSQERPFPHPRWTERAAYIAHSSALDVASGRLREQRNMQYCT